jgi:hypothetical protein
MKVGFLHVGDEPRHAEKMVASVKRHMPFVEVVQWTDEDTPEVQGADQVIRHEWNGEKITVFKMQCMAANQGDTLILDTDIIVQADISGVFNLPFDVALTWRDGPIFDEDHQDITKIMPINTGVMFCRTPEFWVDCLRWCDDKHIGWYSDQVAVAAVHKRWNTLRLHTDNFNYTPLKKYEDVSKRLIVHYKGQRKGWMLDL